MSPASQHLLVTLANVPQDTPVLVDIGGNGIDFIPVTACEVIDGRVVISASKAAPKTKDDANALIGGTIDANDLVHRGPAASTKLPPEPAKPARRGKAKDPKAEPTPVAPPAPAEEPVGDLELDAEPPAPDATATA